MLDDVEDLQARGRLRDLQTALPSREGGPVRQAAGGNHCTVQPIGILAVSSDLQIEGGVEILRMLMNLPQAGGWVTMGSGGRPRFL
ncbi:MAG: hypothetical protein P0Y52_04905 [Candidatus Brevundimonas phytovorans]|nr:hypothetical protein [Brevundimonas sp.]WEK58878.1 MAG: hypothetical protein P0Y52_04905 [Brevundimonas sp.]